MEPTEEMSSSVEVGSVAGLYKVLLGIHGQAVRLCPVDTGDLRKSITIATKNSTEGGTSDLETTGSEYSGKVGSNMEYAAAVEYGRPDMPKYPMQPYLRPAALAVKAKLRGEFTEELNKAIREMARKRRSKKK